MSIGEFLSALPAGVKTIVGLFAGLVFVWILLALAGIAAWIEADYSDYQEWEDE